MATFYVIRHKATNELMPEVHTGYTHWKPGQKTADGHQFPVYLFPKRKQKRR